MIKVTPGDGEEAGEEEEEDEEKEEEEDNAKKAKRKATDKGKGKAKGKDKQPEAVEADGQDGVLEVEDYQYNIYGLISVLNLNEHKVL